MNNAAETCPICHSEAMWVELPSGDIEDLASEYQYSCTGCGLGAPCAKTKLKAAKQWAMLCDIFRAANKRNHDNG